MVYNKTVICVTWIVVLQSDCLLTPKVSVSQQILADAGGVEAPFGRSVLYIYPFIFYNKEIIDGPWHVCKQMLQ